MSKRELGEPYIAREWKIVIVALGLFGLLALAVSFLVFGPVGAAILWSLAHTRK